MLLYYWMLTLTPFFFSQILDKPSENVCFRTANFEMTIVTKMVQSQLSGTSCLGFYRQVAQLTSYV
ncbi:hypothetical protein HanHA89_Chr01g0031191 [Helianthus annuus]|uniref:Uncharacterized protein n=1 Tax=Helianthus annuus TaxID=4232 RepID=A0A251VT11_HELAN|nr:hypothetical protein HanHA89_Chr01g0031191 [Helianthus annuus]